MISIPVVVINGVNCPAEALPGGRLLTVFNGQEYIAYMPGDVLPPPPPMPDPATIEPEPT